MYCNSFFFFQAEDGIRDHCVTGVQTCALPISNERFCSNLGLNFHMSGSILFVIIQCLDYECEMVIVVGKKARNVSVSQ